MSGLVEEITTLMERCIRMTTLLRITFIKFMEICPINASQISAFRVRTEKGLEMTAFWDVVSCSLVEIDRSFRGSEHL
jgi:hypothetical protein